MTAHLLRRYAHLVPHFLTKQLINLYPPFLGAGIRIEELSTDRRHIRVKLVKSWFNTNYVGTQFGGSIYAMTDPFFMLMLMHNLGSDFIVWDQAAAIHFIKPGRSELYVDFHIDEDLLSDVRKETSSGKKYVFDLPVIIHDNKGQMIAKVSKTLYVRRKNVNANNDQSRDVQKDNFTLHKLKTPHAHEPSKKKSVLKNSGKRP